MAEENTIEYQINHADAPQAMKKAMSLKKHGDERVDDYFWMNERENPEVLAYLESENAYVDRVIGAYPRIAK